MGYGFSDRELCLHCDGDGVLGPTGRSTFREAKRAKGLYAAARRALRLARHYRAECVERRVPWREDERIAEVLAQVAEWRAEIRLTRQTRRAGEYAWCIACRGTGLEVIECEGCGRDVDADTLDREPLDCVDVLVHRGCDTGDAFFDRYSAAAE